MSVSNDPLNIEVAQSSGSEEETVRYQVRADVAGAPPGASSDEEVILGGNRVDDQASDEERSDADQYEEVEEDEDQVHSDDGHAGTSSDTEPEDDPPREPSRPARRTGRVTLNLPRPRQPSRLRSRPLTSTPKPPKSRTSTLRGKDSAAEAVGEVITTRRLLIRRSRRNNGELWSRRST